MIAFLSFLLYPKLRPQRLGSERTLVCAMCLLDALALNPAICVNLALVIVDKNLLPYHHTYLTYLEKDSDLEMC